jgi:ATP phosphoribosyltransferase regulatory subunit
VSDADSGRGGLAAAALPSGGKDVLAVEARELRGVEAALRGRFEAYGYREVMTPVLEFADVVERAQEGRLRDSFRLFDETGRVLVLRPDLTIPVARLVATRMSDHPGPVRVSYLARAFRPPSPGHPRASEQRQAGVELVGEGGPGADAEVLALLVESLRATGLTGLRVGVGDVSLTTAVLDGLGVDARVRSDLSAALAARNFVEWRRLAAHALPSGPGSGLLRDLPSLRGGREVLARIASEVPSASPACERLGRTLDLLAEQGAVDAVILDLGVLRDWSYYSGVVVEAYAPGVGAPIAMGGRYDGLGARFGCDRPAVGFAITLDLLHQALIASGSSATPPRPGLVLAGGLDADLAAVAARRAAGLPVVALAEGSADADALAAADGWRYVARRADDGFSVTDRATGVTRSCASLEDVAAWRD